MTRIHLATGVTGVVILLAMLAGCGGEKGAGSAANSAKDTSPPPAGAQGSVAGVVLETTKSLQSQLLLRSYEGFLRT